MINRFILKEKSRLQFVDKRLNVVLQMQDYYFIFAPCISFYYAFPVSVFANVTTDIKGRLIFLAFISVAIIQN